MSDNYREKMNYILLSPNECWYHVLTWDYEKVSYNWRVVKQYFINEPVNLPVVLQGKLQFYIILFLLLLICMYSCW